MIPTIDVSCLATGLDHTSEAARAVGAQIDAACREIGFLLVAGHGIRPQTKANLLAHMRAFFAQPLEDKQRIAIGNSSAHRGYVGIGTETLEGALGDPSEEHIGEVLAGDLKETIDSGVHHGPDHPEVVAGTPLHGPNQLPDLPGFADARDAYEAEGIEAVLRLQRGLALALGLEADFFAQVGPGSTMYHLRMVHYPPAERVTPEPGQLGCGAHTDYGTLTVLADDGVGGLQVRTRSGEWIDIVVPEGHVVMNLGDLMAIWTNDRYVSNPHRVVNPPHTDRYSIPLFVTPSFHAVIEALPTCISVGEEPHHGPMQAGPYLMSRFDGTHSYRNELLEAYNHDVMA